ncbi:unnamed protein product [Linum trigynum]|uniref:Uncharacterized protein n=1 Tax=Linum trigynum TaxID=586398 RepID=A0AAV2E6B9_9ROSI
MRRAVNYSLSMRFKNFKHHCHEHYQKLGADSARQTPHENIKMDDWLRLCDHFESPQFKRQSTANKRSKSMQTYAHTTGGKLCSQRMYEMEKAKHAATHPEEENSSDQPSDVVEQEEPKEMKVYAATHKRTDGSWVDVQPQHNYEMQRMYVEALEKGNRLFGAEILAMVLNKAPTYINKQNPTSVKEKELEERLENSLPEGEKQRQEF